MWMGWGLEKSTMLYEWFFVIELDFCLRLWHLNSQDPSFHSHDLGTCRSLEQKQASLQWQWSHSHDWSTRSQVSRTFCNQEQEKNAQVEETGSHNLLQLDNDLSNNYNHIVMSLLELAKNKIVAQLFLRLGENYGGYQREGRGTQELRWWIFWKTQTQIGGCKTIALKSYNFVNCS